MRRGIWLITALPLALVACSPSAPNGSDPVDTTPSPTSEPLPEDVMENIEMSLWPPSDSAQQNQKPVLSIRASRFTGSVDSDSEWSFEEAVAVAPAQDDEHVDIRFEAAHGVFHEDQRATLQGGVTAEMNDMTIHLEDITWEIASETGEENPAGRAYSTNPVRIESPTQKLEATSMTLNPETAIIELTDVVGEFFLGGQQP